MEPQRTVLPACLPPSNPHTSAPSNQQQLEMALELVAADNAQLRRENGQLKRRCVLRKNEIEGLKMKMTGLQDLNAQDLKQANMKSKSTDHSSPDYHTGSQTNNRTGYKHNDGSFSNLDFHSSSPFPMPAPQSHHTIPELTNKNRVLALKNFDLGHENDKLRAQVEFLSSELVWATVTMTQYNELLGAAGKELKNAQSAKEVEEIAEREMKVDESFDVDELIRSHGLADEMPRSIVGKKGLETTASKKRPTTTMEMGNEESTERRKKRVERVVDPKMPYGYGYK